MAFAIAVHPFDERRFHSRDIKLRHVLSLSISANAYTSKIDFKIKYIADSRIMEYLRPSETYAVPSQN
jgi:hypothetical protein